jgi:hypothetical protein
VILKGSIFIGDPEVEDISDSFLVCFTESPPKELSVPIPENFICDNLRVFCTLPKYLTFSLDN